MELAFEIQGRQQQQLLVASAGVTDQWLLGRAFNSQVIVLDPGVDAQHAAISAEPSGRLLLRDLGSVNGTRCNGKIVGSAGCELASGDQIDVGNTRIRVFQRGHSVPPAQRHDATHLWRHQLNSLVWLVGATLLGLASTLGFHYLGFNGEYRLQDTVSTTFAFGLQLVGWTLFWGVVTRLIRGDFHFGAHCTIGALLFGLSPLLDELVALIGFNAQSLTLRGALDALLSTGLLVLVLFVTLSVATHLQNGRRWLFASVPALLLLINSYGVPLLNSDERVSRVQVIGLSRPPALKLAPGTSSAEFLSSQSTLYETVTELAAKDES